MPRGGKRMGSGRKKSQDPTVTIRVPCSKKELIANWIHQNRFPDDQNRPTKATIGNAIEILNEALKLKANAGGKIKTEIRRVITVLEKSSL